MTTFLMKEQMMRCDHCKYRFSWDCEYYRVSNDYICDRFDLDFSTLTEREKESIQRRLMLKGADGETD
jgi:hypothetical protein